MVAEARTETETPVVAEEPWRVEMNREVGMPSAPISLGELTGRMAFASTRNGPHTVFTMPLQPSAEPIRLVYGFEPVGSPDGRLIAFSNSYFDGGDEIAVMNPDGSDVRRLTTAEGQDRGASWSPDGREIAFWSERDEDKREIYVVSADGSSTRRLTSDDFTDMWPSWSSRGEIAYESYRGDGAEIFAVSGSGGSSRRISPRGLDAREPAWSPDGSQLAFISSTARGSALGIMSADGSNVRKIAEAKAIRNPAWSPDGRFLVFAHSPEGSNEDICIIDAAGGRMLNLTNDGGGFDWEPSWMR